jgi:glycolate oxidase FAD binding subunit
MSRARGASRPGACRDSLIGVRFVDGTGTVLKNGGRVMKNVTGYDLVKLLAGSRGTLGVLTEVAFKVLPDTETQANVVIEGLSPHQAVEAMSTALGSPFEVTGAAHLPGGETPLTLLRLEGFAASVAYRTERLSALLAPFGAVRAETDPTPRAALARRARCGGVSRESAGDVWRISVKPSDAPDIAALTQGEARLRLGRWADLGLACPRARTCARASGAFAGHATLVRASEDTRARIAPFQPEAAPIAALSEGCAGSSTPGAS